VEVLQPETVEAALRLRREAPAAVAVAGGTEVMAARGRGLLPGQLLDLSRIDELHAVGIGSVVRLGAGVTCTRLIEELGERLPVLARAARTVGSRQIRNRATVGGAVALADPSADLLAGLLALDAEVELHSTAGVRRLALRSFLTAPFACDLGWDELVTAVLVRPATGPAAYAKLGARNAMARAVCAVAVVLEPDRRRAAIALAGVGPTPLRAGAAEERFASEAPWGAGGSLDPAWLSEVGAVAAGECSPRSDHRGSARYKRHACAVLTLRALGRAWD
jgi:CO/xanthine dehydrogenase FAD-binding subunit